MVVLEHRPVVVEQREIRAARAIQSCAMYSMFRVSDQIGAAKYEAIEKEEVSRPSFELCSIRFDSIRYALWKRETLAF